MRKHVFKAHFKQIILDAFKLLQGVEGRMKKNVEH